MKLPQVTEINGIRVLTTQQVSDMYGTNRQTISYNFNYNKPKFKEGKHYIVLSGQALRDFKGCHENLDNLKYAHIAYLWTEKGALLHAKSLNTDKAWEAYEYLVDFYFRTKEVIPVQEQPKPEPVKESSGKLFVDVPENPEIQKRMCVTRDYLTALDVALREYDMYHEEDRYKNYRVMVDNLSITLLSKVHDLLEIKPNFVRKHY